MLSKIGAFMRHHLNLRKYGPIRIVFVNQTSPGKRVPRPDAAIAPAFPQFASRRWSRSCSSRASWPSRSFALAALSTAISRSLSPSPPLRWPQLQPRLFWATPPAARFRSRLRLFLTGESAPLVSATIAPSGSTSGSAGGSSRCLRRRTSSCRSWERTDQVPVLDILLLVTVAVYLFLLCFYAK